jgi:hypothetical protein
VTLTRMLGLRRGCRAVRRPSLWRRESVTQLSSGAPSQLWTPK